MRLNLLRSTQHLHHKESLTLAASSIVSVTLPAKTHTKPIKPARWCAGPQFLRQAHRHARGLEGPTETCKASAYCRAKPYASDCPVGLRVRANHLDVQPRNQDFWCHRREWGGFMCSVCVLGIPLVHCDEISPW
jgi:hypothetical protein